MDVKINIFRAFALSFLWHLLCFFMVTIIITPVGISSKKLSDVYFIGSFVDKGSAGRGLKEMDGFSGIPRPLPAARPNYDSDIKDIQPARLAGGDNFIGRKRHYDFKPGQNVSTQDSGGESKGHDSRPRPYIIMSDLLGRPVSPDIIFMPDLGALIGELSRSSGSFGTISFYEADILLSIDRDGRIESAGIIKSAGPPALDVIITGYIKECRFKASGDSVSGREELTIRVKLVL
ncbi:MAG: hypothetical protein PHV77_05235 [Candidatus Omnitrophica bacterium]|nr:hypothetical protein [Candidatus Omnitrophota bacterium]